MKVVSELFSKVMRNECGSIKAQIGRTIGSANNSALKIPTLTANTKPTAPKRIGETAEKSRAAETALALAATGPSVERIRLKMVSLVDIHAFYLLHLGGPEGYLQIFKVREDVPRLDAKSPR